MLIDWQSGHCENIYNTEKSLYIQHNPHKNDIPHWIRENNPKTHVETQKAPKAKAIIKKHSNAR